MLDQAPWNIKGFPLVLKPWSVGDTIAEVDFSYVDVWVQLYGLPLGHSTKEMAIWVARKIGVVLEVDFRTTRSVWVTQYIRIKVALQVNWPLSPGFFLPRANCANTWIQFKFERLTGFCYNYGHLGHLTKTCSAPLSHGVEPAIFSPRIIAQAQDYRRIAGPNQIIPKVPNNPPPYHSLRPSGIPTNIF